MDLVIRVVQVRGRCPVYAVGDTFTLERGYRLVSAKPVCMHSLASLMPQYIALRFADPGRWGLACKDDPSKAVFQCLDPVDFTGGGTVTFEVQRVEKPKEQASPGPGAPGG